MGKSIECTAMLFKGVYTAQTVDRSLTTISMESLLDAQRQLVDSLDVYKKASKRPLKERIEIKAWLAFATIAAAFTPSRLGIEYAHWRQPLPQAAS